MIKNPYQTGFLTRRMKRFFFWIIAIPGVLSILLIGILSLLPFFVNLEPVKHRIVARISKEVGGEAQFRRMALALLPRPQVVLQGAKIAIPDKMTIAVEGLTIVPRLVPLLRGKVRIAALQAGAPTVTLELPAQVPKEVKPLGLSSQMVADSLRHVSGSIQSKAPQLTISVEEGRVTLTKDYQPVFRFQDIRGHARFPPDEFQVDLSCSSNLWEQMSVSTQLRSKDLSGTAEIQITNMQPRVLLDYLVPASSPALKGSDVDLKITLESDEGEAFSGRIRCSSPSLTLQRGEKKWFVKAPSLDGTFHMQGDKATISLAELSLQNPRANLWGELNMDLAASRFRLDLAGRDLEVSPVRETALGLAGETKPVRTLFDILRGGRISFLSFQTQGSSPTELGRLKNLSVHGEIVDGRIFLSDSLTGLQGIPLDMTQARGTVRLSQGILEGEDLAAQWEKTRVSRGSLKLGLEGGDAPFHLEALADVDLAQVPPLLKKLIRNQAGSEAMGRFQEWQGKGRARLILGESLRSIQPRVEVEELRLVTRYERIPFPLKIERARGRYDRGKIEVRNLTGGVGHSSFSDISAQIDLGETPAIHVASGKSSIVLEEIYPWLNSIEKVKARFQELRSLKGTVTLSSINLKGPLTQPEKWDYRVGGRIEKLVMEGSIMPGPLAVPDATFEVSPEKILLQDARMDLLDASLSLSASAKGWRQGLSTGEGTFQGNLGAKFMEWASARFQLPMTLRIQAPLSISQVRLGWGLRDGISLTGNGRWADGPGASIDLLYGPEVLTVNRLLITDEGSRADIGLKWQPKELRLDFQGELRKKTVDRILAKNEILSGSIRGDFRSHFFIDAPLRSTAQGNLSGEGLDVAPVTKLPLAVKRFALEANNNVIHVQSAALFWQDRHGTLEGSVDFSKKPFLVDLDVAMDGLRWEEIEKALKSEGDKKEAAQGGKRKIPPLQGRIGFKTPYAEYKNFTWRPLHLEFTFHPEGLNAMVTEAKVCGMSTPGALRATSQGIEWYLDPLSEDQDFSSTMECLLGKPFPMSGNLNFSGHIRGQGKPRPLAGSLRGPLELEVKDGHIYRESTIQKILAFLNLTDLMEEDREDRTKGEMRYNVIHARGKLQSGNLLVQEMLLDAPAMQLVSQGEIDLANRKVDLMVAVVPLKRVDWIIQRIPIVDYILEGTLISIPVRVHGDLNDPKIIALDPSLIGAELVGFMKRTLKLPFKLVRPFAKELKKQNLEPPGGPKE